MSRPCCTHQHSSAGAYSACSSRALSPAHLILLDQLCGLVLAVQLDCFLSQIINPQMAQHIQVAQQSVHLRGIGFQRQNSVSGSLQGLIKFIQLKLVCKAVCHAAGGGKYAS